MATAAWSHLEALTDDQLRACARILARRGNLRGSLNGKDAADFVQEALQKIIGGERTIRPDGLVEDHLVNIGLSLIWNERQRRREQSLPEGEVGDEAPSPVQVEAEALPDLHGALKDVLGALDAHCRSGRVYRDARDFVACLIRQIEQRASVRPGHIAQLTGMKRDRAYAAWRKVKAVLREHFEGCGS